ASVRFVSCISLLDGSSWRQDLAYYSAEVVRGSLALRVRLRGGNKRLHAQNSSDASLERGAQLLIMAWQKGTAFWRLSTSAGADSTHGRRCLLLEAGRSKVAIDQSLGSLPPFFS